MLWPGRVALSRILRLVPGSLSLGCWLGGLTPVTADGDASRFKTKHPLVRVVAITAAAVDDSETRALTRQIDADTLID